MMEALRERIERALDSFSTDDAAPPGSPITTVSVITYAFSPLAYVPA